MGTRQHRPRHDRPPMVRRRGGRLLAALLATTLILGACTDDEGETDGTLIDPIRPTTVPPPDDLGPGISGEGSDLFPEDRDVVGGGSGTGAGTGSGPHVGVPDDEETPLEDEGPLE